MKPKTQNKKGGAVVCLIFGIIFVLLAIVCFIGDMDYLLGGKAKDLNEIAANVCPQKDDHVRTDSYLVLGNFAETQHRINGIIPAGKEQHYAIVLGDDDMDDISDAKIIVLTVKNKKTIEKLEELANDDYADFSDAIAIEGQIRTPDPEIEGYYRDALEDSGITDYCDYYTVALDATQTRLYGWMIVVGALAIGVICIVAFAKINKQIKNEKNLAYTNAAPAMGQPGNPYINPVTGQPYDANVVNPVTGQTYNQAPNAGYGQTPNQTYNQMPDGAPSVPYTPGQNTDNNPYS